MQANDIKGMTACFTSGLLTATGAETVYDTTAAIVYAINGKLYSKAAVTDGVTPTTGQASGAAITLTASKSRSVVWALNAAGTVGVFEGPIVDWDGVDYEVPPSFGDVAEGWVPFAYQILKADSTAGTITFGTSNWNATGFTNVIVNVSTLPTRPQES